MSAALEFEKVDILFPTPGLSRRKRGTAMKAAIGLLDSGQDRTSIESATGVVVGVSQASLTVQQGQISVLMGLSGSGKSTLLRAANGLNRVTRGRVLVHDGQKQVDVASCDAASLRKLRRGTIAMIFQQFGLLPWRTVRENVGLGLELRGDSADDAPASRRREAAAGRPRALGGSLRSRIVGRYAAARRARARVRDGRAGAADGRAVLRARPADPHQAAGRVARAAGPRAQDHPVRHARSRRGAEARQPDLRARRRAHRADRQARGHRAAAGQRLRRRVRAAHESAVGAERPHGDAAVVGPGRGRRPALARPGAPVRRGARRAGPSDRCVARRPAAWRCARPATTAPA